MARPRHSDKDLLYNPVRADNPCEVIWFFEREGVRLQCEIRPAQEKGFELVWTTPDGQAHTERAEDAAELARRRRTLEQCLKQDGWKRVGRVTPDKRFL